MEEKGRVPVCCLGRSLSGKLAHVDNCQSAHAPFPFSKQKEVDSLQGISTSTASILMCGCMTGGEEYFDYPTVNFSLERVRCFSCSVVSETVAIHLNSSDHIS